MSLIYNEFEDPDKNGNNEELKMEKMLVDSKHKKRKKKKLLIQMKKKTINMIFQWKD